MVVPACKTKTIKSIYIGVVLGFAMHTMNSLVFAYIGPVPNKVDIVICVDGRRPRPLLVRVWLLAKNIWPWSLSLPLLRTPSASIVIVCSAA